MAELLEAGLPSGDRAAAELVARAGRLLFRMSSVRDYRPEILSYPDAARAYEALARGAGLLTPSLDHYALLLSAVQELRTGSGMVHDWGPGRRQAVLALLTAVLDRPEWQAVPDRDGDDPGVRWRAGWARRARAQALYAPDASRARAEGDDTWAWPARRVARLITAGLRARPDLLTRWGLRLGWSGTDFREPDETVLSLLYDAEDGIPQQFLWRLPEDGTPPRGRAAAALHRLATVDPRTA